MDIEAIKVEGNENISSREISNIVGSVLSQKKWGFLPKRNFFVAGSDDIKSAFRKDFDRLEVVAIEKKFPRELAIKVAERKAELVWCSGGACYFVDKNGLAYANTVEEESFFREKKTLIVIDDSAIPINVRETKLNAEFMGFVEGVNSMLREDFKMEIVDSYHTPGAASEELSAKTGEGWILKISSEYTIQDAKKIIQTLFEKDLAEENRKNLEYLDLRIKGKIYYKTK